MTPWEHLVCVVLLVTSLACLIEAIVTIREPASVVWAGASIALALVGKGFLRWVDQR